MSVASSSTLRLRGSSSVGRMTSAFGCGMADCEEKVFTYFFRTSSPIVSVSCGEDKIDVGCQSGAVLTLHSAWLTDGGAPCSHCTLHGSQTEMRR